MRQKFNPDSIKVFDPIRAEARVWTKLEKALEEGGVVIDSDLIAQLIDFARAVVQLQNWKKIGSKRQWENNLRFRLNTIRRLNRQLMLDEPVIDDGLGNDFLDRQLTFALFEMATLILVRERAKDLRDASGLDIELFKLVKILRKLNVLKPVETLVAALQKSDVLKEITKAGWTAGTLKNKISKVPKKALPRKSKKGRSPMQMAANYLEKELPENSKQIVDLSQSFAKMKDSDLYVIVPMSSKLVFSYLFNDVISF